MCNWNLCPNEIDSSKLIDDPLKGYIIDATILSFPASGSNLKNDYLWRDDRRRFFSPP